MKILVVHDRKDVGCEIETIIKATVPDSEVRRAEDGISAREALQNTIFDLLIMDLTLPHFKGGKSDYRVAETLLKELFEVASLNVPGDVIGLTMDAEALELVAGSLGPHVMVIIPEDKAGKWKSYLADKVKYAAKAAITRQISVNQHYLYDALILTALDEEFEPYRQYFDFTELKHFDGANEFLFADKIKKIRKGVAYSIGRSGQARAASWAQSLITLYRPKLALMSGFCGGVQGKASFGDLMIFESSYDWDYGKWSEVGEEKKAVFLARANPVSIDGSRAHRMARALNASDFNRNPKLLSKVELASKGSIDRFEVRLKPAASGSAVITNDGIVDQIAGLNEDIRAVDMESYGFYYACRNTEVVKPEFICMKSVSDFCNGEKGDHLHKACSEISAAAVVEFLCNRWDF